MTYIVHSKKKKNSPIFVSVLTVFYKYDLRFGTSNIYLEPQKVWQFDITACTAN
jgi:hypothetical protein